MRRMSKAPSKLLLLLLLLAWLGPACLGSGGAAGDGDGESDESDASDGGDQSACGAPGHSVTMVVDGVDYPISPATSAPDTTSATATSLGGGHHTVVPGFEIAQERQVVINVVDLSPGTLNAAEGHASLLYRDFPAANEARPADLIIDGPIVGTVTVFATPSEVGERLCGEYELSVSGQQELSFSGHFNHGFDDTVLPGPG